MKTAITRLSIILFSLVLFNACSKFQRVMKSTDMEAKYNAAVKYYDKKDYYHALQLFEELITVFRGTSKAEMSYYYYAYCTYYVDDFTMAAYHFNNFVQSYPNSKLSEEMQYMFAYCFFLDSPVSSLDQTSTLEAIDKFQIFINRYPSSDKVAQANKYIDALRLKLEQKAFDNAKLYYDIQQYKAAVVSMENVLRDYPATQYKEEALYIILKSRYNYAQNSVYQKQTERFKEVRESYYKLIDSFPQSKYLREAERIFRSSEAKIAGNKTDDKPVVGDK